MITSPMEQFMGYKIMGIPHVNVYLQIAAGIPIILFNISGSKKLQANNYGIINEAQLASVSRIIVSYGVPTNQIPLFYSVFYLIQMSNQIGLIPYNNTATAELIQTITLAGIVLLAVLVIGVIIHKKYQIAAYVPAGTPIGLIPQMIVQEMLAFITRTLSQGMRQGVNMITGHILAKVIISFVYTAYLQNISVFIYMFGIIFLGAFFALEIQIAYLQAYIFVFICCLTIHDYM